MLEAGGGRLLGEAGDDAAFGSRCSLAGARRVAMKSIGRFFAGAGLCMAFLSSGADAQDAKVSLRFSHWLPPQNQVHADIAAWSKSVETASGGSIEIKIFPASQLGAAKDHFDMAKNGIADIAWTTAGYTPGLFPAL